MDELSKQFQEKISQTLLDLWKEELATQFTPITYYNEWDKKLAGDPPCPSNFEPLLAEKCIMCGEPLTWDDLLSYHIPHSVGSYALNYPEMAQKGKDCTPSCMWCAQVFSSKEALEVHEAQCR